jgi:hypothetical protein
VQGPLYDYLKSLGVTQPIDPELAADIDALVLARVKAEITNASVGRASGLKAAAAAAAGLSRHLTGVTGCPCSRQVFQGRDEHRQRHLGWSKERIAASSTVLTRRAGERDGSWKRPPPTAKPQRNIPPARAA